MQTESYSLNDSLGLLVYKASRAMANRLNANFAAAGFDVTAEQWKILVHLWAMDGQTQAQLAKAVDKDKTSVTRLLDGLEKRGLATRGPDSQDRRINRICLTDKGKVLQQGLIRVAQQTLAEAQDGVAAKDMAVCKEVLRAVRRNLVLEDLTPDFEAT